MTTIRTGLVMAALVLAAATPASAAHRVHHHSGHEARAQALDTDQAPLATTREKALRDCSAIANRYVQKDWGVQQGDEMRACMTEHGQME